MSTGYYLVGYRPKPDIRLIQTPDIRLMTLHLLYTHSFCRQISSVKSIIIIWIDYLIIEEKLNIKVLIHSYLVTRSTLDYKGFVADGYPSAIFLLCTSMLFSPSEGDSRKGDVGGFGCSPVPCLFPIKDYTVWSTMIEKGLTSEIGQNIIKSIRNLSIGYYTFFNILLEAAGFMSRSRSH